MKSEDLPPFACPTCKYVVDQATCVSDESVREVKEGDYSICLNCGEILVFNADKTQRRAEKDDFMRLMGHPQAKMLAQIQYYISKRGPLPKDDDKHKLVLTDTFTIKNMKAGNA